MDPLCAFRRVAPPEGSKKAPDSQVSDLATPDKFCAETYTSTTHPFTKEQIVTYNGTSNEWLPVLSQPVFTSGKHYVEFSVQADNVRVGVATADCNVKNPLGFDGHSYAVELQSGDCLHKHSNADSLEGVYKRLYKLLVPISGGRVGIFIDMDTGNAALFFNEEYQGFFVDDHSLKGKKVCAAVGIGGLEGKSVAFPSVPTVVPRVRAM